MNTLSPESERRINNIVNLGIVTDVNHDDSSCRVRIDANQTDWLPFGSVRMGNVKIWNPPSVGEQVMVVSENGELDTAVVTGSFDFDNHPMPSANPNSIEMHCKDGAVFSYDHSTHKLDIRLPDESTTTLVSGSVNLRANDVNLQCNSYSVACSSYSIDCDSYTLDSKTNDQDGTMVINGTPYLEHNHSGVRSGGSSTGGVNG